ncbi:chemotaxis protein CheA [Pseudobacteriovorax antillogorgiicola]|uniref:histidine kinase n=1 Tax=Pseudobacteriovorax antillogorgiicola TaxID=1513793 RepID=A0A1Y6BFD3_9BACT|nr:ATP-binding protein [Pseudobacteriovorax antillogorgiicola]TCS56487.1 two-component system chemotaxis sensor kinase CheA [Pseudobacteriovorax antillogorgiicola]SMF04879.1 two-component system, chemotaxis family, sensor kinase CheA [Pseudobacteriovorax antillogorgiicola]
MAENKYWVCALGVEAASRQILDQVVTSCGFRFADFEASQGLYDFLSKKHLFAALILIDQHVGGEDAYVVRQYLLDQGWDIPTVVRLDEMVHFEEMDKIISLRICRVISDYDVQDLTNSIKKYNRREDLEIDQEIREAFIEESGELLEEAESVILDLESNVSDKEALANLFRIVHTIKGSSSVVAWKDFEIFVHRYEDLLSRVESGEIPVSSQLGDVLLLGFDRIKILIEAISSESENRDFDVSQWITDLDISAQADANSNKGGASREPQHPGVKSIKVPVDSLSQLSYYVAVITENQKKMGHLIDQLSPKNFERKIHSIQFINKELRDLEEGLIEKLEEVRCVPVKSVFRPFPRIVRDLSKTLGKSVNLDLRGESLRIDSTIASVLSNTMVHLIRNSLDHGLESPDERLKLGKSEVGSLTIVVEKTEADVIVTIEDDGQGVNLKRVCEIAEKKGLYDSTTLESMSDEEKANIIFSPGFSTSQSVSQVSGRGVGMDMVKQTVSSLGGSIAIESQAGKGSRIRLSFSKGQNVIYF